MKPNTYTQIYIQLVFAVNHRQCLLTNDIRHVVFEYISGILRDMQHKSIIINGTSNHIHIFYGMNPKVSVSDTVHDIKRSSSLFINQNNYGIRNFSWQEGYGGFSYSKSQIQNVYNYIRDQEIHHNKKTFREEYIEFMKQFEIEFNEKYLFDFDDQEHNPSGV